VPVWHLDIFLPFHFSTSFSFPSPFLPFTLYTVPVPGPLPQIQLGSLGRAVSFSADLGGVRRQTMFGAFWGESHALCDCRSLQIIRYALRSVLAQRHTSVAFLRKNGSVASSGPRNPDHPQNLTGYVSKIHNYVSNFANKQSNWQSTQDKNITSLAELITTQEFVQCRLFAAINTEVVQCSILTNGCYSASVLIQLAQPC